MKRRVLAVLVIAALTVPAVVLAASSSGTGRSRGQALNREAFIWRRDNPQSTSSKQWTGLLLTARGNDTATPAPDSISFVSGGAVTVTFSGNFTRAPVQVRVRDSGKIMQPGRAQFNPQNGQRSFSFTFVNKGPGQAECRDIGLEWRSPTGKEARLWRSTVVVRYRQDELAGGAACA